jgi:hypothetical protein
MDSNVQKCTFLAFFVTELFACSLAVVILSVIEVPPIIIDRGMTPLGCLSREVLPETPNRAQKSGVNRTCSALLTPQGQAPPRSMLNRRITIVLNANQSKRINMLIPLLGGPDEPYNVRGDILTQARIKFRIKELSIIYRWGAEVVYDGETPHEVRLSTLASDFLLGYKQLESVAALEDVQ